MAGVQLSEQEIERILVTDFVIISGQRL